MNLGETPATGSPAAPGGGSNLKEAAKRLAHGVLDPLVRGLTWLGVGPDALTVTGFVLGILAAVAYFEGAFPYGSLLLAFSGLCDLLDGQLARRQQRASRFGAFLDSTLDRLSEAAVLTGITGYYLVNLLELVLDPARVLEELGRGLEPRTWAVLALTGVMAQVGSFMVSYTRARAEGLGIECRVGWFERPERLLLIMIAGAFGVGPVMPAALIALTLMSFATAVQRVVHVWNNTRGDAGSERRM